MAELIANKIKEKKELDLDVISGGTNPSNAIHPNVKKVLKEKEHPIRNKSPRQITYSELKQMDYIITMGCSSKGLCPANQEVETIDWDIKDPKNQNLEQTREIYKNIKKKIEQFLSKNDL
ncbi:hypothetical protein C9439_07880 [archaeon SCG-AAA382B04]|nr:hypothetical protein C9439_07880 [archaeon SCG-AAA382B04]